MPKGIRGVPPIEKRWKPGQSGNPAGRPKGWRLSDWLRSIGKEVIAEGVNAGKTNDEAIARVVIQNALLGSDFAISFFAERTEGKVKDVLELHDQSRLPELSDDEVAKKLSNKGKQA